uniref:winged helix-turn-helix domain-containing protein n=1 Tax=Nocardioides sp. TaxID=35761 RepID=UPI00286DAD01
HRWLLQEIWGTGHGEETRDALRTHVRTLRAKIEDHASSPVYIRTESGSGYRWIAPLRGGDSSELAAVPAPAYPGDVLHELANATTALRMAVQLMTRSRPSELSGTSLTDTFEHLDALTARVARLVTALAERGKP